MFNKTSLIVLTFLISGQVFAATINVYTDRTAWETDLAGFAINTETFSNPITAADVITLDNGIISTASPLGLMSTANSVANGRYYAYTCSFPSCPGNPPTEYDWALPYPTYAIGADFFGVNRSAGVKIDIDALGYVGTAIGSAVGDDSPGAKDGFYGMISDTPFDNIDFRCATNCGDGYFVDNFSISPVPVPAAFWLFGTALIGFVGYSRRRKIG